MMEWIGRVFKVVYGLDYGSVYVVLAEPRNTSRSGDKVVKVSKLGDDKYTSYISCDELEHSMYYEEVDRGNMIGRIYKSNVGDEVLEVVSEPYLKEEYQGMFVKVRSLVKGTGGIEVSCGALFNKELFTELDEDAETNKNTFDVENELEDLSLSELESELEILSDKQSEVCALGLSPEVTEAALRELAEEKAKLLMAMFYKVKGMCNANGIAFCCDLKEIENTECDCNGCSKC